MAKICKRCGIEKPESEYYKHKHSADGLCYECRDCMNAISKERRHRLSERNSNVDVYATVFYKRCSKCGIEKPSTEYHRHKQTPDGLDGYCKTCACERSRTYRAKDVDLARCRYREWYARNKEALKVRRREYIKEYARANSARIVKRVRDWCRSNPDRVRVNGRIGMQRRIARIRGAEYSLTAKEWDAILVSWDNKCAYCGVGGIALEQEHFIPLVLGGGYTAENILPACGKCNRIKATNHPREWLGNERYEEIKQRLTAFAG